MDLVNVKEIQKRIDSYKNEIAKLEQLLAMSAGFGGAPARAKATGAAKAPRGRKRGKRGAVTNSIIEILAAAPKPMAAGELRNQLIEKGVAKKGSTTVYAMLLQMSKKGVIKKAKSGKETVYSVNSKK
ncbi:MAG: BlaI/MecI/CopY family transcriptional regulator [Nitrospinota bacterium]|nr:BlaI/MecI/CopY family transcriptional regulator [Nitrospinota bacterium]